MDEKELMLIFASFVGLAFSINHVEKTPAKLRNKLLQQFWTVTRFKHRAEIGNVEYIALTLSDYENVPARYKFNRWIIKLYNWTIFPVFWSIIALSIFVTLAKVYLLTYKSTLLPYQYNEYNSILMVSLMLIIILSVILYGSYSLFISLSQQKGTLDGKGDYERTDI